MSAEYEAIVVDQPAEHVARITLNRPEKRNAINGRLRSELFDALHVHGPSRLVDHGNMLTMR